MRKASKSTIGLDMKSSYPAEVAPKPYPSRYIATQFQIPLKWGNTHEHVVQFLNSIGAHCNDQSLSLREFSKSLTARALST